MSTVAERLAARIRSEGPLTFAAVMEEALYGPGGYYATPRLPIGADGDFVTGSSLSPLYGRATARIVERLAVALGGSADYVEIGYGGGEHLQVVAERLAASGCARRVLAWDRVPRPAPPGVTRLRDLAELEKTGVSGLAFSYELFDALPVHRLVGRDGAALGELRVGWSEGAGFEYVPGELSDPALADLLGGRALAPGQVADLSPGWRPLYGRLARGLERGLVVTCDYGYERARLLDRRVRFHGTLACHTGQRAHRDALRRLGEEDLSAHVDWTALREEGEEAGLQTVALVPQALWLVAAGVFEDLAGGDARAHAQARMLLDGAGMGAEIRVLVQSKDVPADHVFDRGLLGQLHS